MLRKTSRVVAPCIAALAFCIPAPVVTAQENLTLTITQRGGEGSVEIRNENGPPGAIYFTAISFLPENELAPGAGWWGGLHISFPFLIQQVQSGIPFAGFLDSTGASSFSLPAGSLGPNLPTFYAVTRTFGPFLQTITETSNVTSLTPLPAPNIVSGPILSIGPVNPAVPLVRTISVDTDVPTQVELIIDDGRGNPRTVLADPEFKTRHLAVPVLGMRAGRTVTVDVVVRNQNGTPNPLPAEVNFETDPLPADFPPMQVTRLPQAGEIVEPGVTLFPIWVTGNPSRGYLVMLDPNGEVIWYFDGQQNELTEDRLSSVELLSNGNLMLLADEAGLIEITRTGEVVSAWWATGISSQRPPGSIPVPVDTFHHEFDELPEEEEADFLVLSTELRRLPKYPRSEQDPTNTAPNGGGNGVIGDTIVEFKRDGTVVRTVSVLDVLDPYRIVYDSLGGFWTQVYATGTYDWSHGNAVIIDPRDDSYIVSLRNQDAVIKVGRQTGALEWILGPPGRWVAPWIDALLTPLPGAEWNFHQHSPQLTPDGNLLIFDNGNYRVTPPAIPMPFAASYSRAVEFRIDEDAKTVEQVWAYGGPTDPQHTFYSSFVGDADVLPVTGNILVADGGKRLDQRSPVFGRIVEVTHTTPPVEIFEVFVRDQSPTDKLSMAVYRAVRIPSVYPE